MNAQVDEAAFDAIVVGSGAGGATVARELSRNGKKVLILERGADNFPTRESIASFAPILNGVSVGENLRSMRALVTGGTSAIYFAAAVYPDLSGFKSLGIDLTAELEETKQELPIGELPDELLAPQVLRVRQSAKELGHSWQKSLMLIYQSKCANGYNFQARWTARTFVEDAVSRGATLINQAFVSKVIVDGTAAVGVEYELRKGKNQIERRLVFGRTIVIAAGSLATPGILRASGVQRVGSKGFFCQPGFSVFGMVSGLKGRDSFAGSMWADLDPNIALGDGNVSSSLYRLIMLGEHRFIRCLLYPRNISVGVVVNDAVGGEILEDGRFSKSLSPEDVARLKQGEAAARKIIENAGGRNIATSAVIAGHVGGLLRISENLDSRLETHVRNLHVCDGSVIPESFRLPPTLTLVCLGKYLAKQLSS